MPITTSATGHSGSRSSGVPLMAVATVTGTGLPDGVPFDPDRFRDEARILDWEAGIAILPAGQAAADEFARVIACRERSG